MKNYFGPIFDHLTIVNKNLKFIIHSHKISYLCAVFKSYVMLKAIFFNFLFLFSLSAVAFAEGEAIADDFGKEKPKNFSLDNKSSKQLHSFSLRSGMYFKGENLINTESTANATYSNLNIISFQKGQNTYLLPYKKKAILNKLTFNPNEILRNYSGR